MQSVCASDQSCQRTGVDILEYCDLLVLIAHTGIEQLVCSVLFICSRKSFFKLTFQESLNLVSKALKAVSLKSFQGARKLL